MIECHQWRLTHTLVLTAVMLTVAGCSGSGDDLPREAVSGVVTLDGHPLPDGVIQFNPDSQATAGEAPTPGGSTIKGGKFSIGQEMGLVPGNYVVSINAAGKRAERAKPAQAGAGGNKGTDVAKELIPAKYNSKTELKTEIKKGGSNNTLNFDLKSE